MYGGGVKSRGSAVPLRTLKTGIEYMLSRPTKLTALENAAAQVQGDPQLLYRSEGMGTGRMERTERLSSALWRRTVGFCFLGADVIDRALSRGAFEPEQMLQILQSGKKWDWSNKGDFAGISGRSGAVKISESVVNEFADTSGVSVRELYRKIIAE